MNPLQFLYDTVDIFKDGKHGKISLVYDKTGKQFYIMKERDLKTAEVYRRLQEIKSSYLPKILTRNNGLGEKKRQKFSSNFATL